MSEIRKPVAETLTGVLEGKVPLDTAHEVDLLADRHIRDRREDDREARRVGDAKLAHQLTEAQKAIVEYGTKKA